MMLCLCGGMSIPVWWNVSIPVWWNDTIPVWLLYLCGEQKNGVGCVPLELLHQFISLRQAFHGAVQSHDFVALSHTTHSVHVTYNTLSACHTQHTLYLSHTTHSVPVTHNTLPVTHNTLSACHTQQTQGLCPQCCLTTCTCAHILTHTPLPQHTHPTCRSLHYKPTLQFRQVIQLHLSKPALQFRQVARLYLS